MYILYFNLANTLYLIATWIRKNKLGTLDYGISMPAGINMPGGTFDKINKRASWKIKL